MRAILKAAAVLLLLLGGSLGFGQASATTVPQTPHPVDGGIAACYPHPCVDLSTTYHPICVLLHPEEGGVDPRWDNLVAGWHLDEESGPRADVLETYDLTDNNTVLFNTGVIGNAASFVAASSESLTSDSEVFKGNANLTIAAWIRPSSTGTLISRTVNEYSLITHTASGIILYWNGGAKSIVGTIIAGDWNFVVFGLDITNGNLFLSVNGAAPVTAAGINALDQTHTFSLMGIDSGYTSGLMDEVYVFGTVKDAAWITDMYNAGAGRAYPN